MQHITYAQGTELHVAKINTSVSAMQIIIFAAMQHPRHASSCRGAWSKHECVNLSYSALGIRLMSYGLHLPLAKALNIKLQMLLALSEKCKALHFLHAFNGCDMMSSFAG